MNFQKLQTLGWSNFFLQQLDFNLLNDPDIQLFRISVIHRDVIKALGEEGEKTLMCPVEFRPVSQFLAVGDWVVTRQTNEHCVIETILEANNRIERLSNQQRQLICANLDYLFIVTSANDEFNLNRLERYLALAFEFDVCPVIVLTKVDECDDLYFFIDKINTLKIDYVFAINAFDEQTLKPLNEFLLPTNTLAFVGSSGVGKSTLVNHLFTDDAIKYMKTSQIREDDAKGKHTTTHRELLINNKGVILIDTPGMRELKLLNAEQGLQHTFSDIVSLTQRCKFNNCQHQNEKGCAVQFALESGELGEAHYHNYLKLQKEDAFQKRQALGAYAEKKHQRELHMMYKEHKK
ncbi:ribosome small subunit-dependent GTPase A [Marinicellulosiphila megalodicopiae]|uniref:ribosome small subunit-dependent GTPase A n=1 Tax=Marinicellulosiphila megalodicopiae TaxID=2724896 RepID=UPI003BB13E9B